MQNDRNDLISRQAAIDALEKLSANYTGVGKREWHPHVRECQYEIQHMPSAQPEKHTEERTETHACDLINRQAAIDAIDKIFPADPMKNEYTQGITCGAALAEEYIKQLSSAQPERKKGKWLKAGEDEREQIVWNECSECGQALSWQSKYCPNCGADMRIRGEENG